MRNKQDFPENNEIYLKVASFVIKIELNLSREIDQAVDHEYQREIFIKELKQYIKHFTLDNSPKVVDYTITIVSNHPVFTQSSQLNNVSIPLFERISEKKLKTYYYLNTFQFQIVLKDILFSLTTKNGGCVFHASALAIQGKAYIFLGDSTAGKSTIVRLSKDIFRPIADDLIIIKKIKTKYFLYTAPFIEKQWWIKKENKEYELKNVFFIYKGKRSFIKKIVDSIQILNLLLDQVLITKDNEKKIIKWISFFINNEVDFYNLTFRKNKKDLEKIFESLTHV